MKFKNEILAAALALAGNNVSAQESAPKDVPNNGTKNKIEVSSVKSETKESDAREAEVNLEANTRFTQLDLTSFFDTDFAEIPVESQAKIKSKFSDLLSKIDKNNVNDYLLADWNVLVFSDPRKTYKWEGGNTGLSQKRGENIITFLKTILSKYDFKDLTPRIKLAVQNKDFNIIMPNKGEEEGVMYPEELINPGTNVKYTKEEIQKIQKENPSLYKDLLSFCRGVYFMVNLDKTEDVYIINPRNPNLPVTPGDPSIKEIPPPRIPITPIHPRSPHISKAPHYHYWPNWMTNIVQGRGLVKNNKHFKCHLGGK